MASLSKLRHPAWFAGLAAVFAAIVWFVAGAFLNVAFAEMSGGSTKSAKPNHYYFQLGGASAAADDALDPNGTECTTSYEHANKYLEEGAIIVPVCYPTSMGPFVDGKGNKPALFADSLDTTTRKGRDNMVRKVKEVHAKDPTARLTIIGYSLGAQAANQALQILARGDTGVPPSLIDGKLYSDPSQPETGIWAKVPKGVSIFFGMTSPGAGPDEFGDIPVHRYCIRNDGICDATSLDAIIGFFTRHPVYPHDGGVITRTIADKTVNGTTWYDSPPE